MAKSKSWSKRSKFNDCRMVISGIQKATFIDYPGKLAATLFLSGCNFRCPFCHNRNLVLSGDWEEKISQREILDFLKQRKKYLEGVCITGGEPLIHKKTPLLIAKIKKLGYAVKLDTNGTNPEMLKELIDSKQVDYVAIDIKSSPEKYRDVCGVEADVEAVTKSIKLVLDSNLDYEFRSTLLPRWHDADEVEKMAKMIKGAKREIGVESVRWRGVR